jgi:hypothetical protein
MTVSVKAPTSTTGSIQLNGSDVLTIDSSGNLTAPNNLTVTGTVSSTGDVAFDTDTLYVDATNNLVGVGTNSPNDITGTGLRQLVVGNNSGNNGVIVNSSSSGDSAYSFAVNNVKLGRVSYDYLNNMMFQTNNAERMRINSSGNVLVNTTSAYGVITSYETTFNAVTSSWATNGASLSTVGSFGGGLVMIDGAAGYAFYCADSGKDLYIKGNTVGIALTGGVYLNNYATSWSSASDESVKDIIEPIDNAIEKVTSLRTVIGKYKDEEEGIRHPFLIAQDVEKVLPEAISVMNKGEDNECLGLSYTDTIPLLVAAIKEQQDIIKALETRIQVLENPNG